MRKKALNLDVDSRWIGTKALPLTPMLPLSLPVSLRPPPLARTSHLWHKNPKGQHRWQNKRHKPGDGPRAEIAGAGEASSATEETRGGADGFHGGGWVAVFWPVDVAPCLKPYGPPNPNAGPRLTLNDRCWNFSPGVNEDRGQHALCRFDGCLCKSQPPLFFSKPALYVADSHRRRGPAWKPLLHVRRHSGQLPQWGRGNRAGR